MTPKIQRMLIVNVENLVVFIVSMPVFFNMNGTDVFQGCSTLTFVQMEYLTKQKHPAF